MSNDDRNYAFASQHEIIKHLKCETTHIEIFSNKEELKRT